MLDRELWRRRDVFFGGALITLPWPAQAQGVSHGCGITDSQVTSIAGAAPPAFSFNIDSGPISNGSGDKDLDRALAHTLGRLSDDFGILPGFAFFSGVESRNAFASKSRRLRRADGTILFGTNLLRELLAIPDIRETGVAAVCAHEFGHILQYKLGLDRRLVGSDGRVKRLELHADFMAGYFAGTRKRENHSYPAVVFANTQDKFGDSQFSDTNHHGTPAERGAAVVQGYHAAHSNNLGFTDAVSAGVRYVETIRG